MWEFLLGHNATVTFNVSDLIGWHISLVIALVAGYSLARFIHRN
jgi:hypothetical protein